MGNILHVHDWTQTNSGMQCQTAGCSAKLSHAEMSSVAVPPGVRATGDVSNYVWKKKHSTE